MDVGLLAHDDTTSWTGGTSYYMSDMLDSVWGTGQQAFYKSEITSETKMALTQESSPIRAIHSSFQENSETKTISFKYIYCGSYYAKCHVVIIRIIFTSSLSLILALC